MILLYTFSFFLCFILSFFFLRFACNPPHLNSAALYEKARDIVLTNGKRSKSGAPITPPREVWGRAHETNRV